MREDTLYMENYGDALRPGLVPGVARRNMGAVVRDCDGRSTAVSVSITAGRRPVALLYVHRLSDGDPSASVEVGATVAAILKAVNSALGSSYRHLAAEERLDYMFKAVKCPVLEHGLTDV